MTVLSKLTYEDARRRVLGQTWSFPYNCYEIGHGWTPFCSQAALDIAISAVKSALPLYTSLYLFTQLAVQRRYDANAFLETLKSIYSSTFFLSFNLMAGIGISCILRNSTDRYYYRTQCFIPALAASYLALLIERPSRRPALAFYMANLSSELVYKWAESRGVIWSVKHGETALFSAGLACYLHFVRVHGFGHDPVSVALKYLIGPLEAKSRSKHQPLTAAKSYNTADNVSEPTIAQCGPNDDRDHAKLIQTQQVSSHTCNKNTNKSKSDNYMLVKAYNSMHAGLTSLLNLYFEKHSACPHNGQSCLDYSLSPFFSRFVLGYIVKSAMNVPGQLPIIFKQPLVGLRNAFTAQSSKNFGLFAAALVCLSRSTHCALRRTSGKQQDWHSLVAGATGGLSMWFSPRSTLATYVIWKCIEQYFFLAVKNGKITRANEIVGAVYAISVNVLLYVFALEPRFIRPSYMKFIDQLSEHRLHQINRMVLDILGTGCSIGYEDFFPNLDPKWMTRQFQELIFNWLIQPY